MKQVVMLTGIGNHDCGSARLASEFGRAILVQDGPINHVEIWRNGTRIFAKRIAHIRAELPALLRKLKAQGKRIIGYGASAKGNTLLNTCGIGTQELDYIIDNTPFKQNKIAPGTWVPVRPPERLLADQPDYALLLAWNFAPEIIKREKEYQQRGGRFIVPIPEPKIIEPAA